MIYSPTAVEVEFEKMNNKFDAIDDKLTKILVTIAGLEAEVGELWRRLEERELHPPIILNTQLSRELRRYND